MPQPAPIVRILIRLIIIAIRAVAIGASRGEARISEGTYLEVRMRGDRFKRGERGQTLVIFVFAVVGLLAMVGLAIDGGTVFVDRRRMQNAADAGALAGVRTLAHIMCDESITAQGADELIRAEVEKYARNNGVRDPSGRWVAEYVKWDGADIVPYDPAVYVGNSLEGGDGVPPAATGISATTTISHSTYFVSLVGVDTAGASAPAIALTGPAIGSGHMRPFGVPIQLVADLDDEGEFSLLFTNSGGEISWLTETAQHEGWINLGYVWNEHEDDEFPRAVTQNAGASDLREWMKNGGDIQLSADCLWDNGCKRGDFAGAKPGVNASAICQAPEYPETIVVPVYDYLPFCEDEIPGPKPACPTQGGGYVYHIVSFATVEIINCNQGGGTIDARLRALKPGVGEVGWSPGYDHANCELTTLRFITLYK